MCQDEDENETENQGFVRSPVYIFYKQLFYEQPGTDSWKFKQFLGWTGQESIQSEAETILHESKGSQKDTLI